MFYLLYNSQSGNLIDISTSEFPPERLEPQLVLETREGDIPDPLRMFWNTATLDFDKRPMRELSKLEFLTRFTMPERIGARSSSDPIVVDILKMLDIAEFINLDDPNTQQSIGYLAQAGLLSPQRAVEILN